MTEEIVVYYSKGELWKIHIIEKTSIWYKLDHYNFVSLIYAWDGAEIAHTSKTKYVGIVTTNFMGLVDMENLNNNHLRNLNGMESNWFFDEENCISGGITSQDQSYGAYTFYFKNNKDSRLLIGTINVDGNILKSFKMKTASLNLINITYIDINFRISYGDQIDCIYLASSNFLITLTNFSILTYYYVYFNNEIKDQIKLKNVSTVMLIIAFL